MASRLAGIRQSLRAAARERAGTVFRFVHPAAAGTGTFFQRTFVT